MYSLRPKEGGANPPAVSPKPAKWLPVAFLVVIAALAFVAYSQHSSKAALEERITILEKQLRQDMSRDIKQVQTATNDLAADLDVVTKKMGVTVSELTESRRFAEKLRADQERAKEQLAKELATKANTTDVAAAREDASSRVAAAQKDADAKIGNVSGEVKTVATNLESTRQDLAASRREIVDVRNTLSQDIARNSSELSDLRRKGERNFFEFDVRKAKNKQMQRIGDIQLALLKTDPRKQKYDIMIQVDDDRLEKKEKTANEPVQFLVGRDRLRYEVIVNVIDKDRIRGYLSTPKDKVLSAERPVAR